MSQKWLVRTHSNQILGPFPKEDLQEMVRSRSLSLQDEVCESVGFWIPLHRRDELLENLGVTYPRDLDPGQDIGEDTGILDFTQDEEVTEPAVEGRAQPDEDQTTGVITFNQFKKTHAPQSLAEKQIRSGVLRTAGLPGVSEVKGERLFHRRSAGFWLGIRWVKYLLIPGLLIYFLLLIERVLGSK